MTRGLLLMMTAILLAGCARPTEEQRLSKFRGSMKYRTYRFASEKATAVAVAEYNKRGGGKPVTAFAVHSTLSLLWFLADKSEYSFIEADVAADSAGDDARALCRGFQSIALSRMKYPGLARSHYEELKASMATGGNDNAHAVELEHKIAMLSLIAVSLYQGDPDLARFGAGALSAITQLDYLPPLVGAVIEAKKGSPLKAAAHLRELSKSEGFAGHKKALIAEVADILASSPDKETLGDELTRRVLCQLVQRILDDIFTAEDKRALLEKTRTLPALITGQQASRESAGVDPPPPADK